MILGPRWISATRQRWKVVVLYLLTAGGMFLFVGGLVPQVSAIVTRDRLLFSFLCALYGPICIWLDSTCRALPTLRRSRWLVVHAQQGTDRMVHGICEYSTLFNL
jgi:hypothetical protein